jgi:hypothetical protein
VPKRKRRDKRAAALAEGPPVDPSVALFAKRERDKVDENRNRQRALAAERNRAAEHERLTAAKDKAVAEVKRLRKTTRATEAQRAEADAAYRTATADLIAHETGERPHWDRPGDDDPAGPPEGTDVEPTAGEGES